MSNKNIKQDRDKKYIFPEGFNQGYYKWKNGKDFPREETFSWKVHYY